MQELIGAFIVLLAGLSTMIAAAQGLLLPSLVGLAISYALSVSINHNDSNGSRFTAPKSSRPRYFLCFKCKYQFPDDD